MAYDTNMKITILAIGKKHDPKLLAAIEDYSKRLNHYTNFEWKLVEQKITTSMGENEIRNTESKLLLKAIEPGSTVILLDETGAKLRSLQLAQRIQAYMNQGIKQVTFVIGGAYGVSDEFKQHADYILSLSDLVFPHQLVRLIVVEQLYRAHTIIAGEKYHHA